MPVRRIFMDWAQPALPAAIDYFEQKFLDPDRGRLDMDKVLVVVPGSRAARRLSQLLALRASELGAVLFPPAIQTVGNLPEHLYEPKRPFADELTQHLAWMESINSQKARARKYFPNLPSHQQTTDWLDLAAMLSKIHRELAADGLDFSDVVERGKSVRGFSEARRWRFLRALQEGYLDILDGLELWDMQTARLFAIKHKECQTDREIFLLGTVDLNKATRKMLGQVMTQVVALIHAPESEALGFDELGCLEPAYWQDKKVPIDSSQVLVTDQPEDQADAVCHLIAELGDSIHTDELVIGVPQPEVALYIDRKLEDHNIRSHWSVGQSLGSAGPARLLEAIGAVIELDRYPEMAVLLRHPHLESWLEAKAKAQPDVSAELILSESDSYYARHLIPRFGPWLGDRKKNANLQWGIAKVQDLIKPLRSKSRKLSVWVESILAVMTELYEHVDLDRDDDQDLSTIRCLTVIRNILESFASIPSLLDVETDCVNFIRLVVQRLGQANLVHQSEWDSVELLGWLDLPLDVAENVIITGFNDGTIPEFSNSDMFLPNQMRKALELNDNQRRFARDAYATTSMVHSKRGLHFVAGKRNLAGDPLLPSRIFFATDRETIAERVLQVSQPISFVKSNTNSDAITESDFLVPAPRLQGVEIQSISVTSFKTYIQCPYRYYLQHVLKLGQVHDDDRELNALAFGNYLHEVFRRFGESRLRYSSDGSEISNFLEAELNQLTKRELGSKHLPAVEIQLQQMRHRLQAFAQWQAKRTTAGWEIKFVEKKPLEPSGMPFEFESGRTVRLKGSIDRIDFHEKSETWQILDYKTGEKGDEPYRTHQDRGQWVDLQLPLYKHLAREFEVEGRVELGYILIPKSAKEVKAAIARWSDEQLEEALEVARNCAKRIVELEFWEPTHPAPPFVGQEFASICQDNVFEPRLEEWTDSESETSVQGGSL